MSLPESEQIEEQVQFPSVDVDKCPTDYNAEEEADKTYQIIKTHDKTNVDYRLIRKLNKRKRFYALLIKMYHIIKELAIMCCLALTYAALTSNPSKISKSPPAVRFFPQSSIVDDWYRGDLSAALTKAKQFDIAFIMFYAPWDAECQAVRHEFDLAARYMHKDVTFLAVNCWQPGSDCRNQYLKAYNWPILIAYLSHGKGIHYRGVHSAPYMIKFLISLSRPLTRIYDKSEIGGLLALNDAVVVGHVNAFPGSIDYAAVYNTAINVLEGNPTHGIAFAVLTGIGSADGNDHKLSLHLWNETLFYPSDEKWKSDAIVTWIQKSMHQVSTWALPNGKKSYLLSTHLQPGPTLILFTPKNPLATSEDYYNLLHEVALEYHDCREYNGIAFNTVLSIKRRLENYLNHKSNLEVCGIQQKKNQQQTSFSSTVSYTISKKWVNNSCSSHSKCVKHQSSDNVKDRLPLDCKQDCSDTYRHQYHANSNVYKNCADTSENKYKSTSADELDHRLPSNLFKIWEEEKCRRVRFARKIFPYVYSETITNFTGLEDLNFVRCKGLACNTNATLSFIALDSLQHYHFAERLGIDLSSRKDRTVAVIVNNKMETHHIMHETVNDETLRQFVVNFTVGDLGRAFTAESDINMHTYSSKKICSMKSSSEFCLLELNSHTFLPTVLQEGQVVIVFYYSKQCSFCSGISYTFLTVAKIFSSISVIKFVRIDGDLNTLPWEYTMERYPTILLFPFRRKTESRVFPQNMPITVTNLINFLLINIKPSLKLHAMWTICNQAKLEEDRLLCIASTRSETLSLIDRTLRVWRNADVLEKAKLLYKLQLLRNINLLLALHPQDTEELQRYFNQLHLSVDELNNIASQTQHIKDEL